MSKDQEVSEVIYDYIDRYIKEKRYSPSMREIARACQVALSTVSYHVERLELAGRLRRLRYKSRSIRLLNTPQRQHELSEEVYRFISSLEKDGINPSQDEIAAACHLSKSVVHIQLKILEEAGRIRLGKGHRQIQITE